MQKLLLKITLLITLYFTLSAVTIAGELTNILEKNLEKVCYQELDEQGLKGEFVNEGAIEEHALGSKTHVASINLSKVRCGEITAGECKSGYCQFLFLAEEKQISFWVKDLVILKDRNEPLLLFSTLPETCSHKFKSGQSCPVALSFSTSLNRFIYSGMDHQVYGKLVNKWIAILPREREFSDFKFSDKLAELDRGEIKKRNVPHIIINCEGAFVYSSKPLFTPNVALLHDPNGRAFGLQGNFVFRDKAVKLNAKSARYLISELKKTNQSIWIRFFVSGDANISYSFDAKNISQSLDELFQNCSNKSDSGIDLIWGRSSLPALGQFGKLSR